MDCGGMLLDRYLLGSTKQIHSRCACAFSMCRGGLVWIVLDKRIADLKTRLAILESGETNLQESVEGLYRGETVFQESVEAVSNRVDALHESVDKLQRRVDYQSEWCQSLQERIGTPHRS